MKVTHQLAHCNYYADTEDANGWHVPGYARITFEDGTFTTARPHTTSEYLSHTKRAGYNSEVGAFTVEHELAHAFIAEALGHPYSQVQWNDAHGVSDRDVIVGEERLVRWFQRYANTGADHKGRLQPLLDAGLDLDALVGEWRMLARRVFGAFKRFEQEEQAQEEHAA